MSKVWFITGAGRGIGARIAQAALAVGDRVVATGRHVDQLSEAYAAYGERVLCLPLDVAREQDAASAVEVAQSRFGAIDVLVNNAGYGQLGLFEEVASAEVERQFQTNVFGLMHVTRAVLPVMRKQRRGHIMSLSSVGGFMGFEASSIYCAAKFAVEGFSESLALEVAPFNIKVTVIEPGFFRTDFLDQRSVQYGTRKVAEYAEVSNHSRSTYEDYNHQQPGDPVKLGRVVVELAAMPEPPLHFLAGTDALGYASGAFERRRKEMDQHAQLSVTTDGAF
ncbi:short-chain dehydrogenase [Caldimonas brevitalea]|uniref:Dehydrogenase-related protein n=2 Tax=Caldimonas brevitalea TaxID=413882 RepID=A8KCJ8_9BURK|nr:short-chain dehydrogenase [Caldimonas brevitalea]CAL80830.1 dehydrogenase-related protein [Caldimonas brevitalea]